MSRRLPPGLSVGSALTVDGLTDAGPGPRAGEPPPRAGDAAGDGADDDGEGGPHQAAPPGSGAGDGPARGRTVRDELDDAIARGLAGASGPRRAGGGGKPGEDRADAAAGERSGTDRADGHDAADAADDHYVPPPPPKAPRIRPVTRLAVGAIVLGVVILLIPELFSLAVGGSQEIAGVLLILGGVGVLVARMGDRPSTDEEGPDDGAVL
ncbi:DUF308 domain-containing protein [Frankia nepalensis]|uniref:DUF308 domain-containing protein n=1 Tax=Frankia nepalensis TaxID=1836974 RepID=UPI001EE47EA0|nr:DUF308 domain-containing protein [Frankia nepalensis]